MPILTRGPTSTYYTKSADTMEDTRNGMSVLRVIILLRKSGYPRVQTTPRTIDYHVLSIRLLLAMLSDDIDETSEHVEAIKLASGCTRHQFEVAMRSAFEAAHYWKQRGQVEEARAGLLERMETFVDMAARV